MRVPKKWLLVILALIMIGGSIWGGIVLAADQWSSGYDEVSGTTLDIYPDNITIVDRTCYSLTVSLGKSVYSSITEVRYSPTAYPTSRTSGYPAFPLGSYVGDESTFMFSPSYPSGTTGGQIYYLSAWGYNDTYGWSNSYVTTYGYTRPCDPKDLHASAIESDRVDLSWTRGQGGDTSVVMRKTGSLPISVTDPQATQVYSGVDLSCSDNTVSESEIYYYAVWAFDTDSGYYSLGCSSDTTSSLTDPQVVTMKATNVSVSTAQLNAHLTDSGAPSSYPKTVRVFFQYGLTTSYGSTTSEYYPVGTGDYVQITVVGLSVDTLYHFRAAAYSPSYGVTVYGEDFNFLTAETVGVPQNLTAVPLSGYSISISWIKGEGSQLTYVQRKAGSYPVDMNDGYRVYDGEGNSFTDTNGIAPGLYPGNTYFYRAWAFAPDSYYSYGYAEDYCTTLLSEEEPEDPETPNTPGSWYQDPTDPDIPLIGDLIETLIGPWGIPMGSMWLILWAVVAIAMGSYAQYKSNTQAFAVVLVAVWLALGAGLGVIPVWIIFFYIVAAGGSIYAAERA